MYALAIKPKSNNRYLWTRYYYEKRLIDMQWERLHGLTRRIKLKGD